MNNHHHKAKILLSYRRLIYDLSNNAFVVGDALPDGDAHGCHLTQDITEGQNRDRIDRVLYDAFMRIRGLLAPFLRSDDPSDSSVRGSACHACQDIGTQRAVPTQEISPVSGCSPSSDGYYVIHLWVPPSVTDGHVDHWAILAYEYMVAAALADWLEVCAPSAAEPWRSRRDSHWQQLGESVKLHNKRVRRTLQPI